MADTGTEEQQVGEQNGDQIPESQQQIESTASTPPNPGTVYLLRKAKMILRKLRF